MPMRGPLTRPGFPAGTRQATPLMWFATMAGRETGVVKFFDPIKGFGYITRSNGEELYVNYCDIRGTGYRALEQGQHVEFALAESKKGPVASDVTLANIK